MESLDYDFIGMSESIRCFGEKNILPKKQVEDLRRVYEEILAQNLVLAEGVEFPITISVEYSEKENSLEMRFTWRGERYDPMENGDEISIILVKASITGYNYDNTDGVNSLVVKL